MTQQGPHSGSESRAFARSAVLMAGRLFCCGEWRPCRVVNVSAGGARLKTDGPYCQGQELILELGACGQYPGVAAWARGDEVGFKFTCDPAEVAEVLVGLATYG